MKRNFKRTMTMLTTLAISVGQVGLPAMAETKSITYDATDGDVNVTATTNTVEGEVTIAEGGTARTSEGGDIKENNGTVTNNGDNHTTDDENDDDKESIGTNNGTVTTNNWDGTVGTNTEKGTVKENLGTVNDNKGTVETNKGTVETNEGTVKDNGTVTYQQDQEIINSGTVNINSEKGTITNNNKYSNVITNDGKVETNNGTVGENTEKVLLKLTTVL